MTQPYYDHAGITIYHGDCREIMPTLETETVITDPVWPNAHPDLVGSDDPWGLFSSVMDVLPPTVTRLAIWLGCQSDPRFLLGVPERFPFLRMCYLRRAVPSYNGRCLVSGEVLYCFGQWPPSQDGHRVLPGETSAASKPRLRQDHPAARNEDHALWVLKWWGEGIVLDPFCGSGTILLAAKLFGCRAIGIEIEERYCEDAARRLGQDVFNFSEEWAMAARAVRDKEGD